MQLTCSQLIGKLISVYTIIRCILNHHRLLAVRTAQFDIGVLILQHAVREGCIEVQTDLSLQCQTGAFYHVARVILCLTQISDISGRIACNRCIGSSTRYNRLCFIVCFKPACIDHILIDQLKAGVNRHGFRYGQVGQIVVTVKHIREIGRRIKRTECNIRTRFTQCQFFQSGTAGEHFFHIYAAHIKVAQVNFRKGRTIIEHRLESGGIGIPACTKLQFCGVDRSQSAASAEQFCVCTAGGCNIFKPRDRCQRCTILESTGHARNLNIGKRSHIHLRQ